MRRIRFRNLASAVNGAGFRLSCRLEVDFLYDANTRITTTAVHTLGFEHRKITIVKDGIDLPLTTLVGMDFKSFHIRHNGLRFPSPP